MSDLASAVAASARQARAHRRNCEQLAGHARLAGALLDKMTGSNDQVTVRDSLEAALELIESCQCRDRSWLYMLAVGWDVAYHFRGAHDEIDRRIRLVPMISLAHEFRMQDLKDGLEAVEEDKREYAMDEEQVEARAVILKPDRTKKDKETLERSLSVVYPHLGFDEALREENEKLNLELQRWRSSNDHDQCRVIEHLISLTENVVNVLPGKKDVKLLSNEPTFVLSGYITNGDFGLKIGEEAESPWKADLFGCCSEPCLTVKTFLYPCGTFSWIANTISEGKISREEAVNNLIASSLIAGCCCYTFCFRKKLRRLLKIEGSSCDDFSTHLLCCSCALVQERRELELRNFNGCQGRKMIPPPYQYMKT